MPVELKGNQLRIRSRSPKGALKFRIQDIGEKGKLQRVAALYPRIGWKTQGWRLNLKDYKNEKEALNDLARVAFAEKWTPTTGNLLVGREIIRKKLRNLMK